MARASLAADCPSCAATRTVAGLEINNERRGEQQGADDAKPYQAIDEVWIRTKENAGDQGYELCLTSAIGDISNAEGARDHTDQENGHGRVLRYMRL